MAARLFGADRVVNPTQAPPSWETLKTVALQRAVPFVGFGFMDNAIMIVAGDYIESSIGLTLGISTMAVRAVTFRLMIAYTHTHP